MADDKINILLVDDQPAKLLSYEVILRDVGENLIKAMSAREALEVLLKRDIAVVLIDVCMPELDGFQLAAMIREHPRFRQTAIIFISAIHLSDVDRLRGYEMGAVDYVPVPVIPEVLRAKVRVFAELYRKNRQLEQLNHELEERVAQRTAELEASTARLLDSERLRSFALAAGRMGSWEWDAATGESTWDEGQCRIFGVDPKSFSVRLDALRPLIHPEDWLPLIRGWKNLLSDAQTFQTEFRVMRPNGEMRWCIGSAAASTGQDGRITRVSGVIIDITDRKEAEERQSLLAREVDHRARNALAVVQAIIRLTRAKTVDAYVEAVASAHFRARTCCSRTRAGRAPTSAGWSTRNWGLIAPAKRDASPSRGRTSFSIQPRPRPWRSRCMSLPPTPPSTARCPQARGASSSPGNSRRAASCFFGRKAAGRR